MESNYYNNFGMKSFYVVLASHQLLKLKDPLFKTLRIKGFFFHSKATSIYFIHSAKTNNSSIILSKLC